MALTCTASIGVGKPCEKRQLRQNSPWLSRPAWGLSRKRTLSATFAASSTAYRLSRGGQMNENRCLNRGTLWKRKKI